MHWLEDPRPQIACQVADEELGLIGYLVVDRTVGGRAGGGIRMKPDVTIDEVAHLARAMTLKFAFANVRLGGAKAGLVASPRLPQAERQARLAAFGRILSPVLRSGLYIPGADLGTSEEDIATVRQAAGLPADACLVDTGYYTARSVFMALTQAATVLNLDLSQSIAAIEGFGKVGVNVARLMDAAGVSIIAVSTLEGAIYNPRGLNVHRLITLKEQVGDELVHHYPDAERLEKADLLTLPTDFLIPCAGPWTIHNENAAQVQTKVIVPGANIPLTSEAEEILFSRGILYIPDFVANCGGGLSSSIAWFGFGDDDINRIFDVELGSKVKYLLTLAEQNGVSPSRVAEQIAWRNFQRMTAKWPDEQGGTRKRWVKFRRLGWSGVLQRLATELYRRHLPLSEVAKPLVRSYFRRSRLQANE